MKKFAIAASAAAMLFVLQAGVKADECPKTPKSPRQKCLKDTYNSCDPGTGRWINPGEYTVPKGPKDTCPK